jgi:DNA-binding transcriptional regulator YiaG
MKAWSPEDIKILRSRLGLSQVLFGKRVGVSGTYVYLLEKGVKTPSETLKLLLDCVEEKANRKEVKKKHGN